MAKKKKIITISIVSLLMLLAAAGCFIVITGASAYNHFQDRGFHKGFHKRGMPPFMHKEIGEFILWRMDKGAKKLDLNESQEGYYNAFRTELENTLEKGIEKRQEFKSEIRLEMEKENPDLGLMTDKIKTHLEGFSNTIIEDLTLFNQFYNSLDEKQKRVITDKIRDMFEQHHDFHSAVKDIEWEAKLQEEHLL